MGASTGVWATDHHFDAVFLPIMLSCSTVALGIEEHGRASTGDHGELCQYYIIVGTSLSRCGASIWIHPEDGAIVDRQSMPADRAQTRGELG